MIDISQAKLEYLNIAFTIRTLAILGFMPSVEKCIECETPIKPSSANILDISRGGIVCPDCADIENKYENQEEIFILSGESLQIIKNILKSGLELPQNLKISTKSLKELESFIDMFIKYHLDIKLKSKDFLHKIRDLG